MFSEISYLWMYDHFRVFWRPSWILTTLGTFFQKSVGTVGFLGKFQSRTNIKHKVNTISLKSPDERRTRDFADKLVHFLLARHKHAEQIICVNDPYNLPYSIKDSERILRQENLNIPNIYMKSGDVFPSCKDFHALLREPEKK